MYEHEYDKNENLEWHCCIQLLKYSIRKVILNVLGANQYRLLLLGIKCRMKIVWPRGMIKYTTVTELTFFSECRTIKACYSSPHLP